MLLTQSWGAKVSQHTAAGLRFTGASRRQPVKGAVRLEEERHGAGNRVMSAKNRERFGGRPRRPEGTRETKDRERRWRILRGYLRSWYCLKRTAERLPYRRAPLSIFLKKYSGRMG